MPLRGWVNGIGGCPNVGGICMACTMPGFPDKYMPFMDEDARGGSPRTWRGSPTGRCCAAAAAQSIKRTGDLEPAWRKRGKQLTSGYQKRW